MQATKKSVTSQGMVVFAGITVLALTGCATGRPAQASADVSPAARAGQPADHVLRITVLDREPAASVGTQARPGPQAGAQDLTRTVVTPAPTIAVQVPRPRVVIQPQAPQIVVNQQPPEVVLQPMPAPRIQTQTGSPPAGQGQAAMAGSQGDLTQVIQAPAPTVYVDVPRARVVVEPQSPQIVVNTQPPQVVVAPLPQPQMTLQEGQPTPAASPVTEPAQPTTR